MASFPRTILHLTRLLYVIGWLEHQHYLTANPLFIKVTQEDRNLIMACYTTFLLMGNTILCNSIAVDTVKKYMLAIKDYFLENNQ